MAQRQELVVVNLINLLQTKIETLSGAFSSEEQVHINEYAFNELSKMNADLHNSIKNEFQRMNNENHILRTQLYSLQGIVNNITQTGWYHKNHPDLEYMCRAVKTRAQKINCPGYKECKCGEWVSKGFFKEHTKRNKCVDSLMRIKYEKNNYKIGIDKMLLFNSMWSKRKHYDFKENGVYEPYGIHCLQKVMRKKYLRRKDLLENRIRIHYYQYKTRGAQNPNYSFYC